MRTLLLAALAVGFASSASAQATSADLDRARSIVGCDVTAIEAGASASGSLSSSDCGYGDGSYADYYGLRLTETSFVTISQSSDAFDSYLILRDGDGEMLVSNDDSNGSLDSEVHQALMPGFYIVVVNSVYEAEEGDYTLEVRLD